MREFLDEVLAAERSRIHLERVGEQVDDPLYVVGSLRATSATVWIRRHAICKHTHGARRYVLPDISTARDQARNGLDGAGQRHISTDVDELRDLEEHQGAVLFSTRLDVENLAASMARGLKGLSARLDPFDRTAAELGRRGHQVILRIGAYLAAEAATYVGGDDTKLALRKPQACDQ